MVASVVCATQPVGAHIPGLPNLSGHIGEYAGGGGDDSQPSSFVSDDSEDYKTWCMPGGGGDDSQPSSFVSDDSEDYKTWCTWSDIDECEGDYARFRPDVDCGGGSYRSVLGLDILQGNVASVKGAEVSVGEHCSGLPGLTGTRRSGTAFPVLGLPSDVPDLWNFDHMDAQGLHWYQGPRRPRRLPLAPAAPGRVRRYFRISYNCRFPGLRLIRERGHYFCGWDLALHGLSSSVTLVWALDNPCWGPGSTGGCRCC